MKRIVNEKGSISKSILPMMIVLIPIVALADPRAHVDVPIEETAISLFSWFLGLCIMIIGYFIHRTLQRIEANAKENKEQWKVMASINLRLSHLEGEHSAQHGAGGRRPYDPPVDFRKINDPA